MASHKKGKGSAQRAASTRMSAQAGAARKGTSSTTTSVATISRQAVTTVTSERDSAASASDRARTSGVVRPAAARDRTYRSKMTRYKRRQQRQTQIVGAALAFIAVAALVYFLWPRPAAPAKASVSPTASACTTTAQTGLSGTPAAAGGPAAVSGKLVTLAGCLQYIDTKVGTGPAVKNGDTVTVTYTGWLANGAKFDSSAAHPGQPFSFQVGASQVIPGWDKGIVGMQVGGQRRLIIPSALGYGASGAGSTIPPNATLIFDVQIDKIG